MTEPVLTVQAETHNQFAVAWPEFDTGCPNHGAPASGPNPQTHRGRNFKFGIGSQCESPCRTWSCSSMAPPANCCAVNCKGVSLSATGGVTGGVAIESVPCAAKPSR